MPRRPKLDPQLERAMQASLRAYANGDAKFFDFFADDVRMYTVESAEPLIGRKAFQEAFGPELRKGKRQVELLQQDVQVVESQAILAQTLAVTAQGVTSYVRQSVVWRQDAKSGWQMVHVHNAFAGAPVVAATRLPKNAEAVRVLNERIATVAAAVGVAQ